ncbi:MAG: NADH-quinone oxidoreductase subunit H [Desulfurococcales archaeon]|nr:NADH-quinone oxidoreductase subunit H [Desulfurococcales archaeon]
MVSEALLVIFEVIVFPGFLFLSLLALISQWFKRKIIARMQNRMGPTYVGPIGLAQPFADAFKLLFTKELVVNKGILWTVILFMVTLGVCAISALTLLLPIAPLQLMSPYDVFILIYVLLYAAFAFILVGLTSSNPFSATGSSRYMAMIAVAEPALALSLIASTLVYYNVLPLSIGVTLAISPPSAYDAIVTVFVGISLFIILLAKGMIKPYDIPEAETEIAGGYAAELSGPLLGMTMLMHDAEIAFLTLLYTFLVLKGPYPFTLSTPVGWIVVFVKYFLVLFLVSAVAASLGRLRIEQALRHLLRYSFILSIVAFVIALVFRYVI